MYDIELKLYISNIFIKSDIYYCHDKRKRYNIIDISLGKKLVKMSENTQNLKELLIYITKIENKRQISKIKHKLNDIVVINLFAMLENIEYWEEIEEFAKMYFKALKRYL